MLDANLYTLNFVRSTSEPEKLFLIQESTGEPVYFRLRVPEGSETRSELYHATTLAPLGVFQHLSSKLKLISLANPSTTIELKNSGYINFEWTFYFDRILKFCWRKDIIGMAGTKRGYTCWMSRKPDPDYPCAIYRPGTSTVPASCQFLDFNIRRIENLQDPRGLEFAIILALLGFTESLSEPEPRRSPPASPGYNSQRLISSGAPASLLPNFYDPPIEANEIRVTENSLASDLVAQGHKLLDDPLFVYLSVHAATPEAFHQATAIADQIKHDRLQWYGQELYQYLVDDIMSQETTGGRPLLCIHRLPSPPNHTPPDLLVPDSLETAPKRISSTEIESSPLSSGRKANLDRPPFMAPFSKIASIASFSSRSSAYYQHSITPYYLAEEDEEEEHEEEEEEADDGRAKAEEVSQAEDHDDGRAKAEEVSQAEDHDDEDEEEPRGEAPACAKTGADSTHKKPEPFMVCVNELSGPMAPQSKRNSMVIVVEKAGSRESVRAGRATSVGSNSVSPEQERAGSSVPSSEDSRETSLSPPCSTTTTATTTTTTATTATTSDDDDGGHVERAESVRSCSSSLRSSASSFVEIILSSCCQTYSNAFGSSSPIQPARLPKSNHHQPESPFKRIARKNHSAWKRLSSHAPLLSSSSSKSAPHPSSSTPPSSTPINSADFVANLFARKLHLS
ncbi:uncharacterized protein PGTG_16759 [Puccinia graminis f. sp. tritici CRL 75-36-700-3]|uniref:Uncharacterized protein n=1 Tax=Puccinia graminis f. sp. tritici (strain CRL 75-36-700-3 / race SCCL) TaxID=418459 RepID=E3L2E6_PUCGT|nr:uncharacterized protein PGTG_16759 [Puccinia graminis f. sp. tritici CRL 75-36-700-3]EFP90733.2 hypothetical protein PGTG_16759 [Puccinia graminis f. sp. tritici CRL 75-36-700-3]